MKKVIRFLGPQRLSGDIDEVALRNNSITTAATTAACHQHLRAAKRRRRRLQQAILFEVRLGIVPFMVVRWKTCSILKAIIVIITVIMAITAMSAVSVVVGGGVVVIPFVFVGLTNGKRG